MQRREFIRLVGGLSIPLLFVHNFSMSEHGKNPPHILFPSPNENLLKENLFLLVIKAANYMTALEFSLNLFPVISEVTKRKIKAAVMYPRETLLNNQNRIREVVTRLGIGGHEILWQDKEILSPPKIKKWLSQLIDQGVNTLLYTNDFSQWFLRDPKKEKYVEKYEIITEEALRRKYFFESGEIMEKTVKEFKLKIISATTWFSREVEDFHVYFSQMNSLFSISIYDIIKFMISDYEIPYEFFPLFPSVLGAPWILLPAQKGFYLGHNLPIKMQVRFPESSYKKIYSQIHESATLISPYLDFEILKRYIGNIMVNVTWPRG